MDLGRVVHPEHGRGAWEASMIVERTNLGRAGFSHMDQM
jgi:hypothetical protein